MYGCWLHQCIIVNFACVVQLWIMQPQANAVSYGALYICRSLLAAISLAFHNPSSFRGEAQEDPRERNYCCSRNLVQPLCLAMVSEDRFISPRREVLALNAGKSGPTFPRVSRNRKNAHGTVVRHFFHGSLGTDSSFSESRDSVNGELKKRISCAMRNAVHKVVVSQFYL